MTSRPCSPGAFRSPAARVAATLAVAGFLVASTAGGPATAQTNDAGQAPAAAQKTVHFSASTYGVSEGAGRAYIKIVRSSDNGPATVQFSTSAGTATAGLDYTSVNRSVEFLNGQLARTVAVPIINDATPEADEVLKVALGEPLKGVTLGSPSTATLTIRDDDSRPSSWQLRFRDDFNGTAINRDNWCVFDGPGNGHGPRSAKNVLVHDGMLTLRTTQIGGVWTGAGVCAPGATTQIYGKYLMRMRIDKAYGTRATALLWPTVGFPPEIDFYEIEATDGDRLTNLLTNHYKPGDTMEHARIPGSYSAWHVIGVEWTPTAIRFTMDGKVTATMTEHVPSQKMWLGMVTGVGKDDHGPNASTPAYVDYDIDWVKVYRRS